MKAPSRRIIVRATLALCAVGAIGAFGACKDKGVTPPTVPVPPPPQPPPPPAPLAAPSNLTATATSATEINLTWVDNSTAEEGFRVERCAGQACTTFAEIGVATANVVSFQNSGLTANSFYNYRVRAFATAGASDYSNSTEMKTLQGDVPGTGRVMIGAGEITSCASSASNLTAALIDAEVAKSPDAIIYTVGNNLNDTTTSASWNCFDSRWGKFKLSANFKVALGQRDFDVGRPPLGTDAVYAYFGDKAGAPNGWYAFDVGTTWRVIVLNASTWQFGSANLTDPNSAQNAWLANELTTNGKKCVMAIFNLRRYYSYGSMENGNAKEVWRILHTLGAEVVVSGTDKYYERWAPQNHDMGRDDAAGVRQFIVGTGGRTLDNFTARPGYLGNAWKPIDQVPNLEVRDASTWGVMKFTLSDNSYNWEFIPTTPGGFTDTGTQACH